jgi:subtilisin family serine protease
MALAMVAAAPWTGSARTATAAPARSPIAAGNDPAGWVTLTTGDRVLVGGTDGKTNLMVARAPRAVPTAMIQYTRRGDRYVLPTDAAGLVRDGIVDEQLFNVTGLVRQGYDDAHTDRVPLLVKSTAAARMAAPSGTTMRRALPRVGLAALDEKKPEAAQFWSRLLTSSRARTKAADGKLQLPGDVQRVWLNAKVHANLDQSVPQIGAPIAWSHGFTGAGVTVAVLDTGIDATHPDLAARVGPTADFSGKGNVSDGNGHGTHVASTIAGSGAASGGKYKGVAPDTTLAIGKVISDDGFGTLDAIIAGMQWAATEAHAKVVNMSLGSNAPTDGTDPMSVALNELTRDTGTLFVTAAGNNGADETVGSPAAADAALAVASVSKSDVLSPFSSRGPRITDGAAKPDLSAPGEGIAAAQATGVPPLGEPVGDAYQRLSGTSMATPHVAGSAALLAQQHPDWSADRLKAALMSTAVAVTGAGPYAVGTGRVDVGRATTQPVFATGSVSTLLSWPNQGATKTQTVSWHNTGTAPVTLALAAALTRRDGQPAPAGLVALSASSVTVPAGGDATATVTVTAQDGAAGQYSGILTANGADVGTRTTLSVNQEGPRFDLTVNLVDRDGHPATSASSIAVLFDLDHTDNVSLAPSGKAVRLPAGRYAIQSIIETPRAGQNPTQSFIVHPELHLGRDVVQTLDARVGRPVSSTPEDPAAQGGALSMTMLSAVADCACRSGFVVGADPRFDALYAATVPGTSSPSFTFTVTRDATERPLELRAQTAEPFAVEANWTYAPATGAGTLPAVYAGSATPEDLAKVDVRGKLVVFDASVFSSTEEIFERVADIKAAGGKLAMIVLAFPAAAVMSTRESAPTQPPLPIMHVFGVTGDRFLAAVKAGPVPVSYIGRRFEHRYELAHTVSGKIDTDQVYHSKTRDLVAVRTGYYDNAAGVRHLVMAFAGADFAGSQTFMDVQPRREAIEYFTPGDWALIEWTGELGGAEQQLTLRRGQPYHVAWNKAVAGPSLRFGALPFEPSTPWAVRANNTMNVTLPMFSDSAGRPRVSIVIREEPTGSISLYRNGSLVGTEASPTFAAFAVPGEAARYRLVAEANLTASWWPLSTKVAATWGFRSGAADNGTALPLLTVRFDPAVDLRNRAPGGKPFTFPAYVARQGSDAPPTATLTVDVSYDDGKTWRHAAVTPAGDHFTVGVNHPAGGYASLRAKATDRAGNTVEQTVIRAYAIGT